MSYFVHVISGALAIWAAFHRAVIASRILAFAWLVSVAILLLLFAHSTVRGMQDSLAHPPVWDFGCFWVYGRVADILHQPYNPAAMHQIGNALSYKGGFSREVLDVGFVYPPPTIALFIPLGMFSSPKTAFPFWSAILLIALCASTVLLWRHFFITDKWRGLAAGLLLVTMFPTVGAILDGGQTVYLALTLLLLFLVDTSSRRQGIWLALAVIVKPPLVLIAFDTLLQKQWKALFTCLATVCAFTIAVAPLIGWGSVQSYIFNNPAKRLPDHMLTDIQNQSILGWIVRTSHQHVSVATAIREPVYLIISAVVLGISLAVIAAVARNDRDFAVALLVPTALLIYPHTQWFYTPMLLVSIALLWSRRQTLPGGGVTAFLLTAIIFVTSSLPNSQIFASLVTWLTLIAVAPYIVFGKHAETSTLQVKETTSSLLPTS